MVDASFGAEKLDRCLGGTLGGSNLVTVSGSTIFNSSSALSGSNLVVANGGLTIAGGLSLSGRTLVNAAAALWTNAGAATINFINGSVLSNAPSGTFGFNIGLGGNLGSGNAGAIVNQGLFRKFGSASTVTVEVPFTNSGTVEVDSGTLSINFNSVSYVQNAGVTFLNGGNLANNVPLQILGGSLTGAGLISGSVTNAGLLSPGSPIGQITVSGSYIQTAAGGLAIDLGGTNPVTGFDQLVVSGATKLAGALTVHITNGFVPSVSNQFQVLACSNITGTFSTLNVPAGISVNYSNSGVFLVVTGAVAVPVLLQAPQISSTNFTFNFQTASNQSYTIQQTANLAVPSWTNVTNFDGDGTLFRFIGPLTNLPPTFYRVREP